MSETTKTTKTATKTAAAPAAETPKSKLLAEARTAALGRLLDAHRSEFNDLMAEEAKKRNVEWKRKLTEEEKREQKLRALIAEDPALADLAAKLKAEAEQGA